MVGEHPLNVVMLILQKLIVSFLAVQDLNRIPIEFIIFILAIFPYG